MYWGNHGWGMGFGWPFMVFFWILVVMGIIYLVRLIAGNAKNEGKHDTPLDILKKRYARGEINKAEFEEKKKDLL
ncbi:MAG: SHOCT domain-containing protein [Nitrospirota bacterium]